MMRIGPSGNDELFYEQGGKGTLDGIPWVRGLGLNAFEISFGRGIRMSEETATQIGEQAKRNDVQVSVHAPYYINFGNDELFDKNVGYLEGSLKTLKALGGQRLVVHLGYQGKASREEAIEKVRGSLKRAIDILDGKGLSDYLMCIEVMGKYTEIGNVEEICDLCSVDRRVIPCIDFGHVNCLLQGGLQTNPNKIVEIMNEIEAAIGFEKFSKMHIHWSAIVFGKKGEYKHTILDDKEWVFDFAPLARVIREKKISPTIICESKGIMAQDALKLLTFFG